ncbi:MAG: hypothetical protein U9R56_06010, partial [candidate division Zixibacteria bacterium]|nr:hypothetical protein [candidate division Zixibacteria bacterium]
LIVEYVDFVGVWHQLAQHLGSEPDMNEYEKVVINLPPNAYHAGFRVRFHNSATNGNYDDWFVDDIFVGYPPDYDMDLEPYCQTQYGPAGDTATFGVTIYNTGLLADQYDLSYSNNVWDVSFWDAEGLTEITSTPAVEAEDSIEVLVKIAVPVASPPYETDTADIHATSQNDPEVTGTVFVSTISAGASIAFPMFEPFAQDILSGDRWFENHGAEVSVDGLAPPSDPYSLCLDGGIDTVVTRLIDISGQDGAVLSYYFEAGGAGNAPGTGENLYVEYKNIYGEWININTHLGDGSAMTTFEHVNIGLPADAVHNGFQLRLRSYGTCVDCDLWFVDDIRVDFAPDISVTPTSITEWLLLDDSTSVDMVIDNTGPGGLTYAIDVQQILTGRSVFDGLFESGLVEPAHRSYSDEFLEFADEKGIDYSNRGQTVTYDAGGPDLFGYYWIDSDETDGPAFAWEDVSTTGVDIVGDLDDDNYGGPYELGFEFSYYGNIYTQIYIGSNGIIGFVPTDMYSRLKTPLPTAATPNNIIAWLWDDLDPTNGNNPGAHVYIYTDGSRCVIQFEDYPEYQADPGDIVNAEVILESDGSIKLQYLSVAPGLDVASCAVGIENSDGTDGLEVVYAAEYLHDSLTVLFVKPTEWLTLNKFSGELTPGMSDTIICKLSALELDEGDFSATIKVASNDPDPMKNPWVIPVELTVSGTPPYVCGDIDGDGNNPDIVDLIYLVDWMFNNGPLPPVLDAADVDGSGGYPDVADLMYLVNFMFNEGPGLNCQ